MFAVTYVTTLPVLLLMPKRITSTLNADAGVGVGVGVGVTVAAGLFGTVGAFTAGEGAAGDGEEGRICA